jgi:hypothetical protein
MTGRSFASFGVMLLLAGCAVPSSPNQVGYGGNSGVISNGFGVDYRDVMNNIGIDYAAELSWHDPQRVITAVEGCYKSGGNGSTQGIDVDNWTRRCLAMDYAAYKDNQIATHNYRTPGIAYFSEDGAALRWTIYGPRAGFTTAEAMSEYIRGTYAFVKPAQLNATWAREGWGGPLVPPAGTRPPSVLPSS